MWPWAVVLKCILQFSPVPMTYVPEEPREVRKGAKSTDTDVAALIETTGILRVTER